MQSVTEIFKQFQAIEDTKRSAMMAEMKGYPVAEISGDAKDLTVTLFYKIVKRDGEKDRTMVPLTTEKIKYQGNDGKNRLLGIPFLACEENSIPRTIAVSKDMAMSIMGAASLATPVDNGKLKLTVPLKLIKKKTDKVDREGNPRYRVTATFTQDFQEKVAALGTKISAAYEESKIKTAA